MPKSAQVVTVPDYNHLDYMWASDDDGYVNDIVINFLSTIESSTLVQ